MHEALTKWAVR